MLIVSHRPSLLRLCDRCFRIQDGKLNPFELQSGASPAPKQIPVALGGQGPR